MKAHRSNAIVSDNGSITIHGVPFHHGENVEVFVFPFRPKVKYGKGEMPLKGSVLKYERPFDPAVDPEDWSSA